MKDTLIAYLLWFFTGFWGGHKFYLEKIGMGLLYFFTFGGFFILWVIDFFTLPNQVREVNLRYKDRLFNYNPPINEIHIDNPLRKKKKKLTQEEKDRIVLQYAKRKLGRITPVELAADTILNLDEVEDTLKKMARRRLAEEKVSESGILIYHFDGFLTDEEKAKAKGVLEW
jgi:TM2 domain-containing membrane protein YozV